MSKKQTELLLDKLIAVESEFVFRSPEKGDRLLLNSLKAALVKPQLKDEYIDITGQSTKKFTRCTAHALHYAIEKYFEKSNSTNGVFPKYQKFQRIIKFKIGETGIRFTWKPAEQHLLNGLVEGISKTDSDYGGIYAYLALLTSLEPKRDALLAAYLLSFITKARAITDAELLAISPGLENVQQKDPILFKSNKDKLITIAFLFTYIEIARRFTLHKNATYLGISRPQAYIFNITTNLEKLKSENVSLKQIFNPPDSKVLITQASVNKIKQETRKEFAKKDSIFAAQSTKKNITQFASAQQLREGMTPKDDDDVTTTDTYEDDLSEQWLASKVSATLFDTFKENTSKEDAPFPITECCVM